VNSEPIAALEIGTSRTVLAIGETTGPGRLKIAALGSIPSSGMRKSRILDIKQAVYSVESVLKRVEQDYGYAIGQAYLVVSGPGIRTTPVTTSWQIDGKTVTEEDTTEIYNRSFDNGIDLNERTLLDYSELGYGLDDTEGILQPRGMSGRLLRLYSLFVHAPAARIADAKSVATAAKLEIPEQYYAGTCAAAAVLQPQHRTAGALAIDLGGGSTAYTVWTDGRLQHTAVLGVGGFHVTNDIRAAFSLAFPQAEKLKTESSSALLGEIPGDSRVEVPSSTPGFDAVSVSRRALNTVVNARLRETFTIIREQIEEAGLLHRLGAGVFLTGGGSAQHGVTALAESVFGLPVRIGEPVPELEGLEKLPNPAAYATVAGALLAAQRNNVRGEQSLFSPLKSIFGRFFK